MPPDDKLSKRRRKFSALLTASWTLIQAQEGVQPPYIAIHPARRAAADPREHSTPTLARVSLRKIVTAASEIGRRNSAPPRRREFSALAKGASLGKGLINERGKQRLGPAQDTSPYCFVSSPISMSIWNPFAAISATSLRESAISMRPRKSSTRSICCAPSTTLMTAWHWSACCARRWAAHGQAHL